MNKKTNLIETDLKIDLEKTLTIVANTIRGLSMDAVQAANSGHPGLPLGCAEIGACLFGHILQYNPHDPKWINRDRFILSAGHGSMLLYSCLYLSGYNYSLNDLKQFRQLHSKTPGHPEYGNPGIETTTGPLGQGLASAIGMAIAQKMVTAQLGNKGKELLNNHLFILAGDGSMMEGISQEASSLAGHLKLDNVIVIYDSNDICLDGPTSECFTENVKTRYESYGWKVLQIDGHNIVELINTLKQAKTIKQKPVLIIAKTIIGKGSPNISATSEIHGKPMGDREINLTKERLNIPKHPLFFVPNVVHTFFKNHRQNLLSHYNKYQKNSEILRQDNPVLSKKWDQFISRHIPKKILDNISTIPVKPNVATRQSSHAVIQYLHDHIPFIVGGSADLSCSDKTFMNKNTIINGNNYLGRNIKFGVREFAMASISSGISLHGMLLPFCGTFLTFSDYMKNAIRLTALMNIKVIYQFTHDSILLGEDGPTHQPIEHLAGLRAIPNLVVIRPADSKEVKGAWHFALQHNGPVALILSRQSMQDLDNTSTKNVQMGGYIINNEKKQNVDYCLLATGSEVALAMDVAKQLQKKRFTVRVVSLPSFELFDEQNNSYKNQIMGGNIKQCWAIEAQSSFGWHKYIGQNGYTVTIDEFGQSAPANDLKNYYGFTTEKIIQRMEKIGLIK